MKFVHCLRIVFGIGKYTDIFGGRGDMLGFGFYRENLPWRGRLGGEFFKENVTLGGFDRMAIRNYF